MDDRKARLMALAAKAGRIKPPPVQQEEHDGDTDINQESQPSSDASTKAAAALRFRNYTPSSSLVPQPFAQEEEEEEEDDNDEKPQGNAPKRQKTDPVSTSKPQTQQPDAGIIVDAKKQAEEAQKLVLEQALERTKRQQQQQQQLKQQGVQSAAGIPTNSSLDTKNNASLLLTTLTPPKINWDLKRDIADKLERLERLTQKTIVELLRERLEHEAAADDGEIEDGDDDGDLD